MNILQVGSALDGWAGIEKFVLYLTDGLQARGHVVEVTVRPGSPMAARYPKGVVTGIRYKLDPRALAAYLRLLRSTRFDIVHTHYNRDFLLPALAARLVKGPKLVMSRHVALPWPRYKATGYSRLYDRIVPVSEAVRRKLLASGVPDSTMVLAKAGCPPMAPDTKTKDLGPGFNVGFFGRLAEEKGIGVLLNAAQMLSGSSEVRFHVFGDGPLASRVENAGLKNLRFHGFCPDVEPFMASVDAVVVPSTWEEAFPYAVLEAMACGRAVVASDIGGLPELVQDGITGGLFPPGNAKALAEALQFLADQPDLVSEMGENGLRVQSEMYTVEMMAARFEAVYAELLSTR